MLTQQNKLDTLMALEASSNNAMIPMKDGSPIADSGTTIGMGVDLGAQTENSLRGMGMSDASIATMKPYLGLKGQAAKTYLDSNPLTLSQEDTTTLNTGATGSYWGDLEGSYRTRVGGELTDLNDNQQAAMLSAFYNMGPSLFINPDNGNDTGFTSQLRDKDYTAAANNLHTWSSITSGSNAQLIPRRQAEAQLFQGLIGIDGLSAEKDSRLPEFRRQRAIGEAPVAPYMAADRGILSQVGYAPPPPQQPTFEQQVLEQGLPPQTTQEAPPQADAGFLSPVNDFINSIFGGDESGKPQKEVTELIPKRHKATAKTFLATIFGD